MAELAVHTSWGLVVISGVPGLGQAGVVESWVDQQRLRGSQRTQLEVRAALGRVAVQLNESLELEVVLDRVCREAVAILRADKACVSCAGFDGHHQATEGQRWQHHGSTRRNFGSERSG